jgi:colanic acid biosynthesis protein WcaH
MFVSDELYSQFVKCLPIVCVDIIIEYKNKFCLVKRKDDPLKGMYWVPGGRVMQGETLKAAACRKLKSECGISALEKDLFLEGLYQDFFDQSAFGKHPYHTISIVFKIKLDEMVEVILDETSSEWTLVQKLPKRLTSNLERE